MMANVEPPTHGNEWSRDDIRNLRRLVKGKTSTRVIATQLGRAEDSIRRMCARLDLSLKPTNRSLYGSKVI